MKADTASLTEHDYTQRRGAISAFGRAVIAKSYFTWSLLLLVVVVITIAVIALSIPDVLSLRMALILVTCTVMAGALVLWKVVTRQLIEPELATRKWIQQICDGELGATIDLSTAHPHYQELDFHTRNVGTSLRRLSDEMESLVDSQTRRLERQNRVLELLFQLTSDVAHEIDQQSVLNSVCSSLAHWLGTSATVGAYMKVDDAVSLQAASELSRYEDTLDVSMLLPDVAFNGDQLTIPIMRGNESVGVLLVRSEVPGQLENRESQQVFKTLSEQLSMFVARHYVLESVQQARLVKERAALGAELHDSLAQTLLACKYQVRMLRENLEEKPTDDAIGDLRRIAGTIDEANVEVRELIGQMRRSTDQSFADSMAKIIEDHNTSGGITTYFQNDNPHLEVTGREASVLRRIVREALTNANKYSNASAIRVYFRVEHSGARSLLIEDDGCGFDLAAPGNSKGDATAVAEGDHIGLSIMRDRAMSIGALLTIDTEPGEGTRISLKLPLLTLKE